MLGKMACHTISTESDCPDFPKWAYAFSPLSKLGVYHVCRDCLRRLQLPDLKTARYGPAFLRPDAYGE